MLRLILRAAVPTVAIVSIAACSGGGNETNETDAAAVGDAALGNDAPANVPEDAAPDTTPAPELMPAVPPPGCTVDNTAGTVRRRDGFLQICADPAKDPAAVCGDGSPFKMSYRPAATGTSTGLLVYFRGGGACSDYQTCWGNDGLGGTGRTVLTMDNTHDTEPEVSVGHTIGYFDRNEPTNPFRTFDVVYISYCTGDFGLMNSETVLDRPAGAQADAPATVRTWFHGAADVRFGIAAAKTLFPSPARVAIVGSSAGAISSMNALPDVLAAYPGAALPVAYFGEGGIGIGAPNEDTQTLSRIKAYDGSAGTRLVRFGQLSFVSDATQAAFAPAPYNTQPPAFAQELHTQLAARIAAGPGNYRAFAPSGTCHTLAQNVAVYQKYVQSGTTWKPAMPAVRPNPDLALDGVGFDAWLGALVNGTGPFDATIANHEASFTTLVNTCPVPPAIGGG